jgi:FtsH-binding integral membrane protein
MQDPRYMSSSQAQTANIDAGLRSYMLGVYNHMTIGMAITGFFALLIKNLSVTTPDKAVGMLSNGIPLSSLGVALYGSPLQWLVMLAPLGMVFWLSARVNHMQPNTARTMFYTFAAVMGVSLSSILLIYTGASIVRVFFITAISFSALSIYGYTTKRDLSPMGSFLMMGVVGLILASIVNMFMQDGMFQFIISFFGVLIFAGLTAYDTQAIKLMYRAADDKGTALKKSIMGALRLYLDFINMFIMLLSLLGNRE